MKEREGRERERERERERYSKSEREERGREGKRERWREGERDMRYCAYKTKPRQPIRFSNNKYANKNNHCKFMCLVKVTYRLQ